MNIDNDELRAKLALAYNSAHTADDFMDKIIKLIQAECDKALASQRQALRDEVMEAVGEYTDLHTKYEGAYDGTGGLYTSIEDNESQELTGDKLALLANFVSDKTVNELRTAISTIFEGEK